MKQLLITALLIPVLFCLLICIGPVDIPLGDILSAMLSTADANPQQQLAEVIILQSRMPMAIAAMLTGALLSASGLIMQTTFQNPLAGPSVLGVSSGASLGVGLMILGSSTLFGIPLVGASSEISVFIAAFCGAMAVVGVLSVFSSMLRSGVMLLVVGVMISYLASSIVSLLNYFAPAEGVKSFMVWGLGSLTGITLQQLPAMALLSALALVAAIVLVKPLDALLLGERYAQSMGYNIKRLRLALLIVSGLLTAVATAYCGPIGFVGLIVPQLCRMILRTNSHTLLMPMSILGGAVVMMLCALIGVIPSASFGILPINTITPIIGVPVILYIILRKDKTFLS